MLRTAVYAGLRTFRVAAITRRLRDAAVVLCYHNVLPPRNAGAAGDRAVHLSFEHFAAQIDWLARHYTIAPLSEIMWRLETGRPLRGLAALTFDDGYEGVFDTAWPLLRALGLPATVFVVAGRPDRRDAFWWDHPEVAGGVTATGRARLLGDLKGDAQGIASALSLMTAARLPASHRPAGWESIAAAVALGLEIGCHSATHRTLTTLDDADIEQEIVASRDTISVQTGATPAFFAYPYGVWDGRVRDAVRAAGYRGAVSLDYGLITARADPWALARVNIPAGISLPAFDAWVAGLHPRHGRG